MRKHPFSSHATHPKHKLTQAFKIARNIFYVIALTEDNSSQFNRRQSIVYPCSQMHFHYFKKYSIITIIELTVSQLRLLQFQQPNACLTPKLL